MKKSFIVTIEAQYRIEAMDQEEAVDRVSDLLTLRGFVIDEIEAEEQKP